MEGSNWMRHSWSQHSVQLVKREKNVCSIYSTSMLSFSFFSPLPSSSCRNNSLSSIMVSLCKNGRKSFSNPHSSLLVKNIIKLSVYISDTEKKVSCKKYCLNILFWPFPHAKIWTHSIKQTAKCCSPFYYNIYMGMRPSHDAGECPFICQWSGIPCWLTLLFSSQRESI